MSERCRNFLRLPSSVYEAFLESERVPETCQCEECEAEQVVYRCTECMHARVLCATCMVKKHSQQPFHVLEQFDGKKRYWTICGLADLGLEVNLGHGGSPCPTGLRARPMTIVHERGIWETKIRFCNCCTGRRRARDDVQLLQAGLWPASWITPRTVFTMGLMRQFQLLSVHAHTNAYDFIHYLARRTNDTFPGECEVSGLLSLMRLCADGLLGSVSRIYGCDSRVQLLRSM